jgi:K+-sensing histidine kinase KdpD
MEITNWERRFEKFTEASEVYEFVAQTINNKVKDALVVCAHNHDKFNKAYVVCYSGVKAPFKKFILRILNINPIGRVFSKGKETRHFMFQEKIPTEFRGGIYEFAEKQLPKFICRILEISFGVKAIYTIGLQHNNTAMGSVMIFKCGKSNISDFEDIQFFIEQASCKLYHIIYKEDIENLIPVLKEEFAQSLLKNLNHEIRTPLNAIVGLAHATVSDELPEEEKLKLRQNIWDTSQYLTRVIDRSIFLSELETGTAAFSFKECEAIWLANALRNCLNEVSEQFGSRDFLFSQQKHSYSQRKVMVDKKLIKTAFKELVNNAFKFSTAPVKVTFSMHDFVEIQITDNGIGLTNEEQEMILENFVRKNYISGILRSSWIGLSTTHHIIKKHKGTMRFSSALQQGTTFTIKLPTCD